MRTLKLPFREAHHVTGRIVAKAAEAGVPLEKLPLDVMQAIEPRITKAVFGVLSVDNSVKSRTVYGGTAPQERARAGQTLAQTAAKSCRKRAGKGFRQIVALAVRSAMLSRAFCGVALGFSSDSMLRLVGIAAVAALGLSACGRNGSARICRPDRYALSAGRRPP